MPLQLRDAPESQKLSGFRSKTFLISDFPVIGEQGDEKFVELGAGDGVVADCLGKDELASVEHGAGLIFQTHGFCKSAERDFSSHWIQA